MPNRGGVGDDLRWCMEEQLSSSCKFIFMITFSLQQMTLKGSFLNTCEYEQINLKKIWG